MSYPPDNLEWDRLKADIRRATDCVDLYPRLHPDPAGNVRDGGSVRCIDPGHEDGDPSMSLHSDGFKCHACGASGDVFNLWALAYRRSPDGEDFKKTVLELADDCGLSLDAYTRHGETAEVEPAPPPQPPPQPRSERATEQTNDRPPKVRREIFARIWKIAAPLSQTDEARRWLESRSIPPHVAQAYGCRDWRPAMDDLFDVLRNYTLDELHRAGLVNDDGKPWWPLRAYQDGNDDERGLAVPVWHPNHPEAPVAVRWRTYSPDAYRKAYQQPAGPGRFQQPPLGLCEPAPDMQVMLGASWLNAHVDVETAREWMDDGMARPVGEYPGPYAVVLCEGATDWLSVAAAGMELETGARIVPVGYTSMGSEWQCTWTDVIAGADKVAVLFDYGDNPNDDTDPKGVARRDEIRDGLRERWSPLRGDDFVSHLRDDDNDLNDLREDGDLNDLLRFEVLPEIFDDE